ncbi:acyl--CoA ligase [Aquibacillus sp. 3ASR75-11]|uniref:Acyl--CoA ligase n=1 Tax=Terrihalobacillus insolitus TaxID=2950438 RepID=A0A9X3WWK9_9BACI|nr:class I adenylate-forming enzyme family protein [Terrihalobacillus insolitus]MDC3425883.1 acyl--CoA ligase [Terrihalobacillus insolitus]
MSKLRDLLFRKNENPIVLTTFSGDYTAQNITNMIDHYVELLKNEKLAGKKVGLLIPTIPSYLSLVLAINQLGGTVVPLSWQFRKEDLLSVLSYLNPHIVLTVKEFDHFSFADVFHSWAKDSLEKTVIYESTDCKEWEVKSYGGKERPIETERIDFICCSSGSTGTPKGLVIGAETLNFSIQILTEQNKIQPSDRIFLNAPPNAVFGISALLTGVYNGARVVFPDRFDFPNMIKLMKENNCNKLMSTPSIFKAIYQVAKAINPDVVKQLELVSLTGEMMTEGYAEQFDLMKDCAFFGMYGTSEIGGAMFCDLRKKIEFTFYNGVDHKISDNELLIKSPSAFSYYYLNPELTEAMVTQDGWIHTGDLVQENKAGKFEIIGRKKDIIKKGGQQVIPSEIEQHLSRHKHVKQAVVIGTPHPIFGEQIVAFVVTEGEINKEELFYFCSQSIARYKVPDVIELIDDIPVSQGKIDKISLRKWYEQTRGGVKK